jgi:hypothetical protein
MQGRGDLRRGMGSGSAVYKGALRARWLAALLTMIHSNRKCSAALLEA